MYTSPYTNVGFLPVTATQTLIIGGGRGGELHGWRVKDPPMGPSGLPEKLVLTNRIMLHVQIIIGSYMLQRKYNIIFTLINWHYAAYAVL